MGEIRLVVRRSRLLAFAVALALAFSGLPLAAAPTVDPVRVPAADLQQVEKARFSAPAFGAAKVLSRDGKPTMRPGKGRSTSSVSTDEVIVGFEGGKKPQALRSAKGLGGVLSRGAKSGGFFVVKAPKGVKATEFSKRLMKEPGVRYAEPDYRVEALLVPDDPNYSQQWGMARIGASAAWDVTQGAASTKIAIVDTGVDLDHVDLMGRIDTSNDWDFVNHDSTANDDQGHGTHCAGIAAASTDNSLYVAGVAGRSTILPVKVLGADGYGSSSAVADGIRWAADHGADVISLSLGSSSYSYAIDEAVQHAVTLDCVVVAAAGNDSSYGVSYPARLDNVIAVGSISSSNNRSSFSNYGPEVDICAPGENILSTVYTGGVDYKTGTSMATPHVAGVAALVRTINPGWTRAQVQYQLESTALDLGSAGADVYYGSGMVRAAEAVGSESPPPPDTGDDEIPGVATPGSPIVGTVHDATDRYDVYQVSLRAGQTLSMSLTAGADTDFDLYLYGPTASSLGDAPLDASMGTTYPEVISHATSSAGIYFVAVHAYAGSGEYTLEYSADPPLALDDDIPGVAAPASPITGTVDRDGDRDDVYRLDLEAGQVLFVSLNGPASSDFDASLFSPASTSILFDIPVAQAIGISYPDEFSFTAPVAGTYYLDVGAYSGSGSYSLDYSIVDPPPPAADDDIPGVPISASPQSGNVDATNDRVDVFSMQLSAGDLASIDLVGDGGTDFDLYLFDSTATSVWESTPVAYSGGIDYPDHVEYSVPAGQGGTYYAVVYAYSGTGSYSVSYATGQGNDDDIPGIAAPASPIGGAIDSWSDPNDVYRISISSGQRLDVELNGLPGTDFDVHLYGPGSTSIDVDSPVASAFGVTYPEVFSYSAIASGTYYLRASAFSGSGTYTVSYSITDQDPRQLAFAGSVVDQSTGSPVADAYVRAHDQATEEEWYGYVDETGRYEIYAPAGTYTLEAADWSGRYQDASVSDLTFDGESVVTRDFALEPWGPDMYEPDDSAVEASPIVVNGEPQLHSLSPSYDEDWVYFEAIAGTRYVITTDYASRYTDTYLYLYDSDLTEIDQDDDSGTDFYSRIVWTAPENMTAFLKVQHYDAAQMGDYYLSVVASGLTTIDVQHDAAGVTFDRWVTGYSSAYSGGGYVYGRWAGTRLDAKFTGSSISWVGPKQPAYGMADVYVDDVLVATGVDCYAPAGEATLSAKIWESGTLTDGPHTLSIRLTGAKNAASTGNVVVLDRFEVTGVNPKGGGTRIDDSTAAPGYTGSWLPYANPTYFNKTYAYSRWTNAAFTATFTGTKVAWIGPRTTNYGIADVLIDGAKVATVDTYRANLATQGWREVVWESGTLSAGTHTIAIRPTGTKNPAATAANIVIDAIDVRP